MEKVRREKMQVREKVGKSRFTVFFQWIGAPESNLVKAAGAEPSGRDEKLHAVVARSTLPSQNVQSTPKLEHFWKLRCRKKGAPLWREASTPCSDHFWKLRCRKSARRCGAKHISKSKVSKTHGLRPLLEVEMSKKCALLWREAHFQVKMVKTPHVRSTLWKCRCRKSARRCGAKHISKSKVSKTHGLRPLLEVEMSKKCALLWREAHFQVKMVKTPHVRSTLWKCRCRKSACRCGAKHIAKSKW